MTIPKEIVNKMEQVNALILKIDEWLDENIETEGSKHCHREYYSNEYKHSDYYQFTDEANGEEQNNGEYCDQWTVGGSEDSFQGFYYYPTEKGNYFYFDY